MGQSPGIEKSASRFIDDCDFYAEVVSSDTDTPFIDGKSLYAGYMRNNWGHFLVNSTARLWPACKDGFETFDHIVFFAENDNPISLSGNFKEFFELLGILEKVIILPPGIYRFNDLTIGQPALEIGCYCSREFMLPFERVRTAALASAPNTHSKGAPIILSRSQWNGNNALQINLGIIESIFTAGGYEAVSPENVTLSELIVRMESASEIVSCSGSTAHNILFSSNPNLVILERCAANNVYQIGIMKMTGRKYTAIDCFYQPLLVPSTDNLTIYGLTPQLCAFIADRSLTIPENWPDSPLSEFRRCLKIFRRHHGYASGLNEWETAEAPAIYEAYFDSRARYRLMLERRIPVMWYDYFSPRVIFRSLKTLIGRK